MIKVTKSIKAFIDDVAMSATMLSSRIQDLIMKVQTQLQWWDKQIKVTGGELNPSKCCRAIHTWQPDKLGILQAVQPNPDKMKITLSDKDPMDQIPILQQYEGTCYFGLYIAPDGSTKTMEMQLWKKSCFTWLHFKEQICRIAKQESSTGFAFYPC